MTYYDDLIETLSKNNDKMTRLSNIINPFSMYYLCDHYYGADELHRFNIPIPNNKHNLLATNNLSLIKDYDIIHVPVDFFNKFCSEVLDKINNKFILTTGKNYLPQLHKNQFTEKILQHPNVILWLSQNPIYENGPKYIAFPYGIADTALEEYSKALLRGPNEKNKDIEHLHLHITNPCREKLPKLERIPIEIFYTEMAKSKFILSPIGDRDDCHRHYEAIGLGTIPIANVNTYLKTIFEDNMYYCNIDEMSQILSTNQINCNYSIPNKDLICFNYYKDKIHKIISAFS